MSGRISNSSFHSKLLRVISLKCAQMDYSSDTHASKIQNLKPKQIQAICAAAEMDTIAVLPTGYGKSLVYELLPYYIRRLHVSQACQCQQLCVCHFPELSSIIVVSPLNAIIHEKLQAHGPRIVHITPAVLTNPRSDILHGEVIYLIGHPEDLLCAKALLMFKCSAWQRRVTHIIVDEAHCLVTWGQSFREDFQKIHDLKAHFTSSLTLAMTATASLKMQNAIAQILHFKPGCFSSITHSCDRPNVFYAVRTRPPTTGRASSTELSHKFVFTPLLMELKNLGNEMPRTVVFTKVNWCGYGHELALHELNQVELMDESVESSYKFRVAQFHAPQTTELKSELLKLMRSPDSHLRLLLATEAYSMGADSPNIRRIVHIGPPATIETFVQETGRAGRDGKQSEAVMYVNKSDIAKNVVHLTDEMREYCSTSHCRRKVLMEHLNSSYTPTEIRHLCCDNCQRRCQCLQCATMEDIGTVGEALDIMFTSTHADKSLMQRIQSSLMSYFDAENSVTGIPLPELHTGLTSNLADKIAKDYPDLRNIDQLKNLCPGLDLHYLENIHLILSCAETA